ncbi:hypothetical protein CA603_46610 [Paraburkholderia hospita]|nr:hypothetical protein CA603_46610 [Paraburkholderia hospita]
MIAICVGSLHRSTARDCAARMKYVADACREVQCKAMHTKLVARRVVAGSAACTIVPGTGCMKFAADKQ